MFSFFCVKLETNVAERCDLPGILGQVVEAGIQDERH